MQVQLQLNAFLMLQRLPVQLETVFWIGSDVQTDIIRDLTKTELITDDKK